MNDYNNDIFSELIELLKLKKTGPDIFTGQSQDLGFKNLFGGHVVGQALSAASQTVKDTFHAHSIHCYFMLAGNASKPIIYEVERIRDGGSFVTRRVVAVQDGSPIFSMSASFHIKEGGYEHFEKMPEVEGPEKIESDEKMIKRLSSHFPDKKYEMLLFKKPIEIRIVNPVNPFDPKPMPPEKYIWFRTCGTLPDDSVIHRCMLAYVSDFHMVGTILYPHGKTFWSPDMMVASLDHSLWIHKDFKMDDWLLYAIKSPIACEGRGLSLGRIYTRDGGLIASVAQEGMVRRL